MFHSEYKFNALKKIQHINCTAGDIVQVRAEAGCEFWDGL